MQDCPISCLLQKNRRDQNPPESKENYPTNPVFNATLLVTFRIICSVSSNWRHNTEVLISKGYFYKPKRTYQFFPGFSLSLVRWWKDCPYQQACPGECQQGCRSTALTVVETEDSGKSTAPGTSITPTNPEPEHLHQDKTPPHQQNYSIAEKKMQLNCWFLEEITGAHKPWWGLLAVLWLTFNTQNLWSAQKRPNLTCWEWRDLFLIFPEALQKGDTHFANWDCPKSNSRLLICCSSLLQQP